MDDWQRQQEEWELFGQSDYSAALNDIDQGLAGSEKPRVVRSVEPYDRHSWARSKAAKKLGIPESELNDEPDNDPGGEDQAWA